MWKLISYLFFIHLIVNNVESNLITDALEQNPITNTLDSNNSIKNLLEKGVKQGKQLNTDLKDQITNNSLTNFIKNGTALNCLGLPDELFNNIIERVFTRGTKAADVNFYFYSRDQEEPAKVNAKNKNIELSKINFSTDRRTVIISHGFMSSGTEEWVKNMTKAFLQMENLNVIAVDWAKGSNTWNYIEASINTRIVGTQIAKLLHKIKQKAQSAKSSSDNFTKLHLVGHSLGAHISAHASYQIKQLQINDSLKWDVERISGLDPAQPCFTSADPSLKLDKGDASFVDVIHSNGRQLLFLGLGLPDQLGHEDFYPNGGQVQLGCDNINGSLWKFLLLPVNVIQKTICSHGRSYQLFTDSIRVKVSGACVYQGHKWDRKYDNLKKLLKETCDDVCPELGINAINYRNSDKDDTYFVPTGDNPPYCDITKEDRAAIEKQLRQDKLMEDPTVGLTDKIFG